MSGNPRFGLAGRTVIVTGGGKGIGKAYAQELAKACARVVASDTHEAAAKAVAQGLAEFGSPGPAAAPGRPARHPQVGPAPGTDLGGPVWAGGLARVQVPDGVGGAVMFLSSPPSDFMTGQPRLVEGGNMID